MSLKIASFEELDAVLSTSIEEGGLVAAITIVSELQLRDFGETEIRHYLNEKDICVGVIPMSIKRVLNALKKSQVGKKTVVARGTPVEESVAGELTVQFNTSQGAGKPGPDICSIRAGQVILKYTPSYNGKPGMLVSGELQKPTSVKHFSEPVPGQNVQVIEEGDSKTFIAMAHGHLQYAREIYSVLHDYTYNGNLTAEAGEVKFMGNLIVNGSVESGVVINCMGDVTIAGDINEDAVVHVGGNLVCRNTIQCGTTQGLCKVKGNIVAESCKESFIHADGGIIIKNLLEDSIVNCHGEFITLDGRVLNSVIRAGKNIRLSSVGSPDNETKNMFEVGCYLDEKGEKILVDDEKLLITVARTIYGFSTFINGDSNKRIVDAFDGPLEVRWS